YGLILPMMLGIGVWFLLGGYLFISFILLAIESLKHFKEFFKNSPNYYLSALLLTVLVVSFVLLTALLDSFITIDPGALLSIVNFIFRDLIPITYSIAILFSPFIIFSLFSLFFIFRIKERLFYAWIYLLFLSLFFTNELTFIFSALLFVSFIITLPFNYIRKKYVLIFFGVLFLIMLLSFAPIIFSSYSKNQEYLKRGYVDVGIECNECNDPATKELTCYSLCSGNLLKNVLQNEIPASSYSYYGRLSYRYEDRFKFQSCKGNSCTYCRCDVGKIDKDSFIFTSYKSDNFRPSGNQAHSLMKDIEYCDSFCDDEVSRREAICPETDFILENYYEGKSLINPEERICSCDIKIIEETSRVRCEVH
ncbi:hypothetical protein KY334_02660, partial [Candidatus Woesearchaeota archaeon]|nr:hypothetical protein [Candidatus Woesearchaeota archaeon]